MASTTYDNAKRNHRLQQMRRRLEHQSQRRAHHEPGFIEQEWSAVKHYLPHSMGLGAVVIAGSVGLMAYQSRLAQTFKSRYFSSW